MINATSSNVSVTTQFLDNKKIKGMFDTLVLHNHPNFIVWYIGPYGLKQSTVEFYRDNIFSKIISTYPKFKIWLVDLTAWNILKSRQFTYIRDSSFSDKIENFENLNIGVIRCSKIFSAINSCKHNTESFQLKKEILNRPSTWEKSSSFPLSGISINSIFPEGTVLNELLYDIDTSKCYSTIQYLEAIQMVTEIVNEQRHFQNLIEIVFLLPNDELLYYNHTDSDFSDDVKRSLLSQINQDHPPLKVSIQFISFDFGDTLSCRPYIAHQSPKELKKNFNIAKMFGDV